jgi:hypothetical protein
MCSLHRELLARHLVVAGHSRARKQPEPSLPEILRVHVGDSNELTRLGRTSTVEKSRPRLREAIQPLGRKLHLLVLQQAPHEFRPGILGLTLVRRRIRPRQQHS